MTLSWPIWQAYAAKACRHMMFYDESCGIHGGNVGKFGAFRLRRSRARAVISFLARFLLFNSPRNRRPCAIETRGHSRSAQVNMLNHFSGV